MALNVWNGVDRHMHYARYEHERQEVKRLQRIAEMRPCVQSRRPPGLLGEGGSTLRLPASVGQSKPPPRRMVSPMPPLALPPPRRVASSTSDSLPLASQKPGAHRRVRLDPLDRPAVKPPVGSISLRDELPQTFRTLPWSPLVLPADPTPAADVPVLLGRLAHDRQGKGGLQDASVAACGNPAFCEKTTSGSGQLHDSSAVSQHVDKAVLWEDMPEDKAVLLEDMPARPAMAPLPAH